MEQKTSFPMVAITKRNGTRAYIAAMPAAPLFRRLMGPAFETLPAPLRDLHLGGSPRRYRGQCEVMRGGSWLARLCGRIAGFPPAGNVRVEVAIETEGEGEIWRRDFGGHPLTSRLSARRGALEERMGPAVFRFRLVAETNAIRWDFIDARVMGIPVPSFASARIVAIERLEGGRYAFDVSAAVPWAGLLVHYRGVLDPV
jgi:hypothetical protein